VLPVQEGINWNKGGGELRLKQKGEKGPEAFKGLCDGTAMERKGKARYRASPEKGKKSSYREGAKNTRGEKYKGRGGKSL